MAIKLGEIDLTTGQIPELNAVGLRKTALSGQTRAGLFGSLTENGDVKVYSDVTFTTAESPDGTATTKFAVTVNRQDANNGGLVAVSTTGGVSSCGVNAGTYSSWRNSNDGDGTWKSLEGNPNIQYCKKNGIVFVEGHEFIIPAPNASKISDMGILPVGYRPSRVAIGSVYTDYGQTPFAQGWVSTNGYVSCWNTTGAEIGGLKPRLFVSFPAA